jgi:ClpP class serine protease
MKARRRKFSMPARSHKPRRAIVKLIDNVLSDGAVMAFAHEIDRQIRRGLDELVIEVHSGGGDLRLPPIAEAIRANVEAGFRIVAMVHFAGSGAVPLSLACSEVVAAPNALIGGVGVLVFPRGSQPGDGVWGGSAGKSALWPKLPPIDEKMREELPRYVAHVEGKLFESIARFRGLPVERVRQLFGGGDRFLNAHEALAAGLVDRVGLLRGCGEYETVDVSPAGQRRAFQIIARREREAATMT